MGRRKKGILCIIGAIVAVCAIGGGIFINMVKKQIKEGPKKVAEYIKKNESNKPVAFALKRNGEVLSAINTDKLMPLASMSKWTVAIEYAKGVGKGILNPEEKVDLDILNRYYMPNTDGGAHVAWIESLEEKGLIVENKTSLREVARGMIMFSSNANTDYLMNKLGVENINRTIKEMGLKDHKDVYPIVAALCLGDYISYKEGIDVEKIKERLLSMSDEEYISNIMEIHELMNNDKLPEGVRELKLVTTNLEIQKIWSDRFISATTNDYMRMMELLNSRTYLDEATQKELSKVVEFLMENPKIEERFKHFGVKGGSTSWVLTEARYIEDIDGNKTEVVVMFNELEENDYKMILENLDLFMTFIVTDSEVRENVLRILN